MWFYLSTILVAGFCGSAVDRAVSAGLNRLPRWFDGTSSTAAGSRYQIVSFAARAVALALSLMVLAMLWGKTATPMLAIGTMAWGVAPGFAIAWRKAKAEGDEVARPLFLGTTVGVFVYLILASAVVLH